MAVSTDPTDELDDPHYVRTRGIFEPPDGFVIHAIARNKLLVLLVVGALTAAGIIVGALSGNSDSTYTAAATLQVGQVNPNSPGFYGYVQSSAALATAFSRAIEAEQVLTAIDHELGTTSTQLASRLSAAPIPQSPAFRVIATGSTERSAVRLANLAAAAVAAYVSESNSSNPEAASLLHDYRGAEIELREAVAEVSRLDAAKPRSEAAILRAEAAASTAGVKVRAIAAAYSSTISSQAPRSGLVTLLAGATNATGNKNSKIELYGFLGLIVGLILGCVAAVVREDRRSSGSSPRTKRSSRELA